VRTVFLLSPAYCGGRRAKSIISPASAHATAVRLQSGTLTLADAFTFCSGLYFRGKIAYARAFAPDATFVITPTRGLQPPDTIVTVDLIREFASVDISEDDPRYRTPLERDLRTLASRLPQDEEARVVLLGSIATAKYVEVLASRLGRQLYFPPSFIGRGDMSRGGLLLRHARSGVELEYAPLDPNTKRHGARPPKLDPRTRVPVVKHIHLRPPQ
jgi:hypothetical protein